MNKEKQQTEQQAQLPRGLKAYRKRVLAQLEDLRAQQDPELEERLAEHGDPQAGQQLYRDLILRQPLKDIAKYGSVYGKFVRVIRDENVSAEDWDIVVRKLGDDEKQAWREYLQASRRLDDYEEKLIIAFKAFQIEALLLYNLVTRKTTMEQCAEQLTRKNTAENLMCREAESTATGDLYLALDERGQPQAKATETFYAKVTAQAAETREKLELTKGYVQAYDNVLSQMNLYAFSSFNANSIMRNLKKESFLNFLTTDRRFYRSHLNERRRRGETITPEEEKWAVFPDYYEIEADPRQVAINEKILCKQRIYPLIPGDCGFKFFKIQGDDNE